MAIRSRRVLSASVRLERVHNLTSDIDHHVKARRFLGSGLEVQIHIVAIDGDWAVGVSGRFLILVIFDLVEWLKLISGAVGDLCSYW